jgi:hypothetical protein
MQRSIRRHVVTTAVTTVTALTVLTASAGAQFDRPGEQAPVTRVIEIRPFVGALLPTGDQRDVLENAVLAGLQLGWAFHPNFALVGTFGWSPSQEKSIAEEDVDIFQYDLGVEGRLPLAVGSSWEVTPYLGLGGGGRTYRLRDVDDADAETNALGYGALGVDIGPASGRYAIRVEARDNISRFKGLQGELDDAKTRNDVQVTGGLTWRF